MSYYRFGQLKFFSRKMPLKSGKSAVGIDLAKVSLVFSQTQSRNMEIGAMLRFAYGSIYIRVNKRYHRVNSNELRHQHSQRNFPFIVSASTC